MKNLYIIGARGFGREVYSLAKNTLNYTNGEYKVMGFLDDKTDALDNYINYPPIIDSVENYLPKADDVFVCAMGTPQTKKKYVELIIAKGGKFINIIHSLTQQDLPHYQQHQGLIVFSNTHISVDVEIGNFVTIQSFSFLGHDVKIGNWSHINTFCSINGFVEIGESVQVYTHSTILPKFKVGDNATVGAGSMVMRNVNQNSTVFGNPARELKTS